MKGLVAEFKEFAVKGNVIDLAVGVVIGGVFQKIVSSLVQDVIMPPIGLLLGGVNFSGLKIELKPALDGHEAVTLNIGSFVQTVVDFLIVAFVIFMVIKLINRLHKKPAEKPAPPVATNEEKLLTDIRDILRSKS